MAWLRASMHACIPRAQHLSAPTTGAHHPHACTQSHSCTDIYPQTPTGCGGGSGEANRLCDPFEPTSFSSLLRFAHVPNSLQGRHWRGRKVGRPHLHLSDNPSLMFCSYSATGCRGYIGEENKLGDPSQVPGCLGQNDAICYTLFYNIVLP